MEKYPVLFVDDDPNILQAFKRQLRSRFNMVTAVGPEAELEALEKQEFAVVISDMKMPVMSGVEFLKKVSEISSNTVRLMLTGNVDQNTVVEAVNDGHVFRFLNKPCSTEELGEAIEAGIKQYRLITAERELLQNTLTGSVKILTDILSLLDPAAFGSALDLRQPIRELAPILGVENSWELELAAMLRSIGQIVVPPEILTKVRQGAELSESERQIYARVPETSKTLLMNIPRLERVAEIIFLLESSELDLEQHAKRKIAQEAIVLKLILDFIQKEKAYGSRAGALSAISQEGKHPADLLRTLVATLGVEDEPTETEPETEIFEIGVMELCPGQIVQEDLYSEDEVLIVTAGHVLSPMSAVRIQNYADHRGLKSTIKVDCRIPGAG